jgi:hypothetical protein
LVAETGFTVTEQQYDSIHELRADVFAALSQALSRATDGVMSPEHREYRDELAERIATVRKYAAAMP